MLTSNRPLNNPELRRRGTRGEECGRTPASERRGREVRATGRRVQCETGWLYRPAVVKNLAHADSGSLSAAGRSPPWNLIWRCRDPRASARRGHDSVERRWDEDLPRAYLWMAGLEDSGEKDNAQSAKQAAQTLPRLEIAKELVEAEEACDDPLRMIPYLLEKSRPSAALWSAWTAITKSSSG